MIGLSRCHWETNGLPVFFRAGEQALEACGHEVVTSATIKKLFNNFTVKLKKQEQELRAMKRDKYNCSLARGRAAVQQATRKEARK